MTKFGLIAFVAFLTSIPCMAAPTVMVSSPIVTFNAGVGGAAPAPISVSVTSDLPVAIASSAITYLAGGANNWLVVAPLTGQPLPTTIQFYVSPVGLTAGSYIAQLQLTPSAAVEPASVTAITVFLNVGSSGGGLPSTTITVSPTSLSFSYQAGGSPTMPQILNVLTNDTSSFNAAVVTDDGKPWLTATPSSSTSPGAVLVSVDPSKLDAGTYTGTVNLTVPPYTIVQVPVTLTVGGPGLMLDPSSLTILEPQNYGFSVGYPVQVTAATPFAFTAFANSDSNWLSIDLSSGTTPATITVRANDSSLAQGTYTGTVTVQTSPSSQFQLPVTLTVGPPATLSLSPSAISLTYQIGGSVPAPQTVRVNSLNGSAQTFSVSSSAAWLTASASPSTTPGIVTLTANTSGLAAGNYYGLVTVTSTDAGASPQQIAVSLTVMLPPKPVISAVTNAASYASGAVAPGEYVTIFGANLGPKTIALPTPGTAPTTLGTTSVTFDGIPAPIIYALGTQTTVQVPYNISTGQTALVVTTQGVSSLPAAVNSVATFPGLFTANTSGQGQLAALNGDLSVNSASNPVARGGTIVLYGTGEGKTQPGTVEGSIVPPTQPLPQAIAPATVTIGGAVASVQYAGETPGTLAGLLQINVTVPTNISAGSNIPVQVTVGGQSVQSNITIAVK